MIPEESIEALRFRFLEALAGFAARRGPSWLIPLQLLAAGVWCVLVASIVLLGFALVMAPIAAFAWLILWLFSALP